MTVALWSAVIALAVIGVLVFPLEPDLGACSIVAALIVSAPAAGYGRGRIEHD
ncbi:hypothetical protein [uncultured Microbacterium sp.]|uniref:hypothetical protein n=1 Tax=uncultured Microbacterium sp. TaxID=191216 RepID=UPI0025FE8199|nr:hypothetical protein [uncultured Microbacterium sp.]